MARNSEKREFMFTTNEASMELKHGAEAWSVRFHGLLSVGWGGSVT